MDDKERKVQSDTALPTGEEEDKQLPEELWDMVREELQQAARVLRSLTDPLIPDKPPAETAAERQEVSQQGWFARLVDEGRHMTRPRG